MKTTTDADTFARALSSALLQIPIQEILNAWGFEPMGEREVEFVQRPELGSPAFTLHYKLNFTLKKPHPKIERP